ncbi:MAG: hypothetical protein ABDH32_02935 [Candidatus Caldarchaeales archaeon]
MKVKIFSATLLILLVLASNMVFEGSAQPMWSLRIVILPSWLYMGEWGSVYVNITNLDCSDRRSYLVEFNSVNESFIEEIIKRAEEMKRDEWIRRYDLRVRNLWGRDGEIYGDYSLTVIDSCVGEKTDIVSVGLWFPFKEIGRGMIFWNSSRRTLEAFNPMNYILDGRDPRSSTILSFKVYIPEDIPSEEIKTKPSIDVRLIFPGWLEYTLEEYPIAENHVEIQPYRTFNLTITDFDGLNPIPYAKVVITRLMYYYERRVYVTPENGTIKIHRLYDDKYEVEVYWNSSYRQMYPFIHFEQHWALDLARSKNLKTGLFTLKIKLRDIYGRPLNGALVAFDGFEKIAKGGETTYLMVPQGNHTAQVFWKGLKIFDGWLWTGYHPTIYPWITKPAVEHVLKLPVGDLIVQAIDTGGNMVGANFTVMGPNLETSFGNIYSRSGLLNITQLPILEYSVRAVNYSKVFKNIVEHSGVFKPGERSLMQLPIHSVKLMIVSATGKPIEDAIVRFGPIYSETDEIGVVIFSGVPRDEYDVSVEWLRTEIYRGEIVVEGSIVDVLRSDVYDLDIRLIDFDGEEYTVNYSLIDPAGRIFEERATNLIKIDYVPEGLCKIVIRDFLTGRELFNETLRTEELYGRTEIKLPVADMRIEVKWIDGKPVEDAEVEAVEQGGERRRVFTDSNGVALFKKSFFSKYSITIFYPYTRIAASSMEVDFKGQTFNYTLLRTNLTVKVVDFFENPVKGADVSLSYLGVPLSKQKTDMNGIAFFKDVIMLPFYDVEVKSRGLSSSIRTGPGGLNEVRLEYIDIAGVVINLSDIFTITSNLIPIITIVAIVVIVSRVFKRRSKKA